MLLIDTYVGPSAIEGVGVFAAEPVAAGQLIYRLDPRFDREIPRLSIADMPEPIQRFLERYAISHPLDRGLLLLDTDNGRHMNHSPDPNTDFRDPYEGYAIRDIAPGEEILCDYAQFEPGFQMLPSITARFTSGRNGAHPQ
jgi:hypothetical protein